MVDENVIVSVRPSKVASLEDLHGLRFGGIAGHLYRMLSPHVEAGRITREDAIDHIANLKKLYLGRVDFIVISRSELAGTRPLVRCPQPFNAAAFSVPQIVIRRVLVRSPDESGTETLIAAIDD
jgi:polar amino acid transport system substrate-binding protein